MPTPRVLNHTYGRAYLMIAIAIIGSASAATRKLTDLGAANLIDGRNPISFCNVLFVGNLCALILLSLLYYRNWTPNTFRNIRGKDWVVMTAVAIIGAAIVPTLIFSALEITPVNNVILISQIEAPLALALSVGLMGDRANRWIIGGAALSFVGVCLTVLLQPPKTEMIAMSPGIGIGWGELLVLMAAIGNALSNLISKANLKHIPLSVFSPYRTVIGTIIFFFTALIIYGPEHFMDVTSPFLWQWMLFYSAVIVVGGQYFWFSGLKRSSAGEISFATAFSPIAGILAAFLLLGEVPNSAQYIGGAIIIIGIICNQIGLHKLTPKKHASPLSHEMQTEVTPYKGV